MKTMILGSMVRTLIATKLIENKFSRESGEDRSIRHKKIQSYYILGSLRETAVCSKFSGSCLDFRWVPLPLARLSLRLFFTRLE